MRPLSALVLVLCLIGCDASAPEAAPPGPDGSVVEGVATLPSGDTVPFRTAGRAGPYRIRHNEHFGVGSHLPYPSEAPDSIEVSVTFQRYRTGAPTVGAFSTRLEGSGRELIYGSFQITNVPGWRDSTLLEPSTLLASFPHGTMDAHIDGRGWLVGTFDLTSYRYESAQDSTAVARVVGRFEMPITPED